MQSETTNTKTTGSIPVEDLKTLYLQYVRLTFEHASPAWFCGLTKTQRECLEKMQRKNVRVILAWDFCKLKLYTDICRVLSVPPLT